VYFCETLAFSIWETAGRMTHHGADRNQRRLTVRRVRFQPAC
jgi:hypothetical protein